jgi:hypothetical protein
MGQRPLVAFGNETYKLNLENWIHKDDNYTRNLTFTCEITFLSSPCIRPVATRQRIRKNVPAATNAHATTEELLDLVFYTLSLS